MKSLEGLIFKTLNRHILLISLILPLTAFSKDTLHVSLQTLDSLFVHRSIYALLKYYNQFKQEEYIRLAKKFVNPSISLEQNLYNQYTGKPLDVTKSGQTVLQVEQLILLAGKRNKLISLQKYEAQLSAYDLEELIREVKYELFLNFLDLYISMQKIESIHAQIVRLQELVKDYDTQFSKGNVSLKEVSRLKSLLLTLKSDEINEQFKSQDYQHTIRSILMLGEDTLLVPQIQKDKSNFYKKFDADSLYRLALEHRPDYLKENLKKTTSEVKLRLEKAKRIPDLKIGALYDRAGSYIYNYYAGTLAFDVPVWNTNSNNIKIAEVETKEVALAVLSKEKQIKSEINMVLEKIALNKQFLTDYSAKHTQDILNLQKAILENYEKRNISLMEFVDFYESYKENILSYLNVINENMKAYETLNYIVGTKVALH